MCGGRGGGGGGGGAKTECVVVLTTYVARTLGDRVCSGSHSLSGSHTGRLSV